MTIAEAPASTALLAYSVWSEPFFIVHNTHLVIKGTFSIRIIQQCYTSRHEVGEISLITSCA